MQAPVVPAHGPSSYGARALEFGPSICGSYMGLVALWRVEYSWTKD